MIDFFGRKAKAQLAEMRKDLDGAYRIAKASARDKDALIGALREMDQLAFMIGQTYGQPHCREHVQKLCAAADKRMQKESDRIRDVLIPEIRKTYELPDRDIVEHSLKRLGR